MKRKLVESSSIKSIGYDFNQLTLEVEFIRGAIYQYEDVLPEIVYELLSANSIGSYFSKHIAKSYKYKQIN